MTENIEFTQQIPLRYTPDIAVVGGGMAGVGAACVAAMHGCSVLLIEEFATLGGAATVGGVWGFCGETIGMGVIFDEILHDLARFHCVAGYSNKKDPAFRNRKYDPEILALVLQEIVMRHHVQVVFHTRLTAVVQDAQKNISCLIIAGPSGLEAVSAKWFIDCTGDAQVAKFARCEVMKGGPHSPLYLPMAFVGFVRNRRWFSKSLVIPSEYFPGSNFSRSSELPMISLKSTPSGNSGLKIKVPMFDSTDTLSLTAAEIEGRRKFMRVLKFYQNHGRFRWTVSHTSPIIGIRDGGQIRGLYILSVEDVQAGKAFFDAVAVGTYSLDAHKPDDDKRTYILPKIQRNVPPYHIPLRSLIAHDCSNLLMAGRHLSADQLAMSSARAIPTCVQMGQAVGAVAALCLQKKVTPSSLVADEPSFTPVAQILKQLNFNLDLGWYRRHKAPARPSHKFFFKNPPSQ